MSCFCVYNNSRDCFSSELLTVVCFVTFVFCDNMYHYVMIVSASRRPYSGRISVIIITIIIMRASADLIG